jgi:hypothetical protein
MTVDEGFTEPLLTLLAFVEVLEAEVLEAEELATDGVMSAPAESRYQFATGSPRHSPTVTGLKPLAMNCWSMYSVKFAVCG